MIVCMSIYASINCSYCGIKIKERDHVVIDLINTLYHKDCFKGPDNLLKGIGTYRQLSDEFSFFIKTVCLIRSIFILF